MSEGTKTYRVEVEGIKIEGGDVLEVGAFVELTADQRASFADEALTEGVDTEEKSEGGESTEDKGEGETKEEETKNESDDSTKTETEEEAGAETKEDEKESETAEVSEEETKEDDNADNADEADADTEAVEEEKSEGDALEETPEEEEAPEPRVGTAVVNSEGLVKTVFTEEDHGADHAEKAEKYATSGGYQTQPWTDA